MKGGFGLLGVPSSAAVHGPGQEKAPAALRRAGLPARLAAAGVRVADYGDLPVVRWRPDPHQRRPHNLRAVLDVLRKTSGRVGEILADGRVPLVLGGECSVTIAVLSAFRDSGIEPALLSFSGPRCGMAKTIAWMSRVVISPLGPRSPGHRRRRGRLPRASEATRAGRPASCTAVCTRGCRGPGRCSRRCFCRRGRG